MIPQPIAELWWLSSFAISQIAPRSHVRHAIHQFGTTLVRMLGDDAFSCLDLCKLPSKMGTNLLLEVDCGAKSSWTKLAINIEFTIFDDQIGVVSRELLEDLERFATSSTARFESG